jgi:hypothetical protein
MFAHPTQATAARQIAGIFGGNLGPLESGTSTLALYRTGDLPAAAPGAPGAPAPGAPMLTPEQIAQHQRHEQAHTEQSSGAFLTMAALGIAVAALRGGMTGAVAASSWKGVTRGALFNGSLAALGVGVAGYVVGQRTASTGLVVGGLLGTAGAVYLATKGR